MALSMMERGIMQLLRTVTRLRPGSQPHRQAVDGQRTCECVNALRVYDVTEAGARCQAARHPQAGAGPATAAAFRGADHARHDVGRKLEASYGGCHARHLPQRQPAAAASRGCSSNLQRAGTLTSRRVLCDQGLSLRR
jgi:hypothetical protein